MANQSDYKITVSTAVDPDGDEGGDQSSGLDPAKNVGSGDNPPSQFQFIITKKHGTGKLEVYKTSTITEAANKIQNVTTGEDFVPGSAETHNITTIVLSDLVGIGNGSKYEITIPAGWKKDKGDDPYKPILAGNTADGVLTSDSDFKLNSYTISGDILNNTTQDQENSVVTSAASSIKFTYRLDKAPAPGSYTFKAKTSSGPHGELTAITDYTITVVAADGGGTIALTKDGVTFNRVAKDADITQLTFTYKPGAEMTKGSKVEIAIPIGWNRPAFGQRRWHCPDG